MKHSITRLISFLLVLSLCFSMLPMEAFAWGKMTHTYTANLIEDEAFDGFVTVRYNINMEDGVKEFQYSIPQEYLDAIQAYPNMFRAGALGPDMYPDILTGQMYIHPAYDEINSGAWVTYLCNAVNRMGKDTEGRKMTLSFTLGCILHYCGDLFGHDFVNTFSGGTFPELLKPDILNLRGERLNNILSHMSVEKYMDSLLYPTYDAEKYGDVDAPNEFVTNVMVFNGSPSMGLAAPYDKYPAQFNLGDIESDLIKGILNDFFSEDPNANNVPPHYTAFLALRNYIVSNAEEYRENMCPVSAIITKYNDEWLEDVDAGIAAFTEACDNIADRMVTGKTNPKIEKQKRDGWKEDYNELLVLLLEAFADSQDPEVAEAFRTAQTLGVDGTSFIDEIIRELLREGIITQEMLDQCDGSITIIKEEFSYWWDEYLPYMILPDIIVDGIEIPYIGAIIDLFLLGPVWTLIKDVIKMKIAEYIVETCTGSVAVYTGMSKEESAQYIASIVEQIDDRIEDPELQLDHKDNPYKPSKNNFAELEAFMATLSEEQRYSILDSDLEPLYNTLTMFQLMLMGPENYTNFIKTNSGVTQTSYQTTTARPAVSTLKLRVKTSDLYLAGTNDNIYAVIYRIDANGSKTEIAQKLMDMALADDFEADNVAIYTVELPELVELGQLEVALKKTPAFDYLPGITDDWCCENIRVTPMYAGYELTAPVDLGGIHMQGICDPIRMNFQTALYAKNPEDPKSQIVTNLKVEIKVKDEQDAGTDSDIYLKAVWGSTYWTAVLLDKGEGYDDLERGKTETYNIPITSAATGTARGIPLDQLYVEFRHYGTDEANWAEVKVTPCYGSLELSTPITLGGQKFQERTWAPNFQTALKKATYREEPTLSQTATSLKVQIDVSDELYAGTDDDIYLNIYSGDSTKPTQSVLLDSKGENDLEMGETEIYTIALSSAAAKIPLNQLRLAFEHTGLDNRDELNKDEDKGDAAKWDEVLVTVYNGSKALTDPISLGGTEFDEYLWDTDFQTNLKLHYAPVVLEYTTNLTGGLVSYMGSLDGGEEWVNDQNELWSNTTLREEIFFKIFKGFAPEIECESSTKSAEITLNFTGVWNGVSNDRRSQVKDLEHVYAVEGTADVEFINDKGQSVHKITGVTVSKNKAVITGYANKNLVKGYYDLKVTYIPDKTNQYYAATEVTFPRAVNITVAPMEITKEPAHQNVKPGEAASLSIEVSGGKAPYTYTWQVLNGDNWEDVKKGSQYSGVGTAKLTFTPNTAGSTYFRCVVKDSYGNEVTSKSAGVNAVGGALLLKQPGNTNIYLGTTATLTVGASGGTAPYTYKWQVLNGDNWEDVKNDSNHSGQGTATLNFKPDKAGSTKFRCVVKDSAGQEITSTTVTVTAMEAAPLVIQSQPQGVTVVPGETAPLTVAVSGGTEPYTYTWQILDGNDWKVFRNSNQYSGQGNPTLYVTSAKEETITFRCVIRDAAGKEILSDSATVIVTNETKPLSITTQPKSVTVNAPQTASFTIGVSGGKAPYTYSWQMDGGNGWYTFEDGGNILGQGTNQLYYAPYGGENLLFRCIVTDSAGNSVTSDVATLISIEPDPIVIYDQPKDRTEFKGIILSLSVNVRGGAEPLRGQWQGSNDGNNWVNLNNGDPGIEVSDTGFNIWIDTEQVNCHKYMRCVVSDAAGQSVTSRVATITIKEKLKVQINDGETEFTISYNRNETLLLTANVTGGEGPYTYKWYVKYSDSDKWREWATTSSLEVNARDIGHGYSFKVEVKDSTGKTKTSQVVKIRIPDEPVN